MKLLAFGIALWITGAFVTVVFVSSAARLSRWKEPEPETDEDLETDIVAAAELALEGVYGDQAYRSASSRDPCCHASLERQVVRAALPGERPRPVGLR